MALTKRTYWQVYDNSGDLPLSDQNDNPALDETLPTASANRRVIYDPQQSGFAVGDKTVSPRGTKNIVWSSEGYTNSNNVAIPALTSAQKNASGSQATNIGVATNLPQNYTPLSTYLDVSAYKYLSLWVNLSAITGTSIGFELDFIDDSAGPNSIAIWKPSVNTAAGAYVINIGPILGTAPSAPSGYTFTHVQFPVLPNALFKWTNVAVSASTWTAILYGQY